MWAFVCVCISLEKYLCLCAVAEHQTCLLGRAGRHAVYLLWINMPELDWMFILQRVQPVWGYVCWHGETEGERRVGGRNQAAELITAHLRGKEITHIWSQQAQNNIKHWEKTEGQGLCLHLRLRATFEATDAEKREKSAYLGSVSYALK